MACPSEDQFAAFVDGRLAPELAGPFHVHVDQCAACSALLAVLARALPDDAAIAPLPAPGDQIGEYKIEEVLGQGGMGIVFRAFDVSLQRPVALKFVSPRLAGDAATMARFEREARAVSALLHPGIAAVFHLSRRDGYSFIVMPHYDGETLAQRLQRGPLTSAGAAHIMSLLLDALAVAHRAGIIHRDLKPSNIMLTRDGGVVLLDFGVAKLLHAADDPVASGAAAQATAAARDATDPLTIPGTVLGTRLYMSPEQAVGGTIDQRADLFAAGAILHHALTGRPARASAPIAARPIQPATDLLAIADKAMSGLASARYASAEEMLADVRRFLDGLPTSARRWPRWQRLRRHVQRNLLRSTAGLLLALALISGILIGGWRHHSRVVIAADRQRADDEIMALDQSLAHETDPLRLEGLALRLEAAEERARQDAVTLGDVAAHVPVAPADAALDRDMRHALRAVEDEPYAIPPPFRASVAGYVAAWARRDDHEAIAQRRRDAWPAICHASDGVGLPELFRYISFVESEYDASAVSEKGAAGLWQFIPETARAHGLRVDADVDERLDPLRSSQAAAQYLAELMVEFGEGAPLLALMSYNLGPERARRLLHDIVGNGQSWRGTRRSFWHLYRTQRLPRGSMRYIAHIVAAAALDQRMHSDEREDAARDRR
jgi:serine/threonine protein kinase/soluble lytic murein transglycosylase-like protein